ncbi:hypothetical protein V2I01_28665 [Micromonospora sp. BRA006-A]|nr:hypothetical protein [Micromonospora sp. BRA006-A]
MLQVPLTYRGAPLAGADEYLVGVIEHSVLGRRWAYDACGDPVYPPLLAAAVLADAGQAEEYFEVDGKREVRPASMTLTGSRTGRPGAGRSGFDRLGFGRCGSTGSGDGGVTVVRVGTSSLRWSGGPYRPRCRAPAGSPAPGRAGTSRCCWRTPADGSPGSGVPPGADRRDGLDRYTSEAYS